MINLLASAMLVLGTVKVSRALSLVIKIRAFKDSSITFSDFSGTPSAPASLADQQRSDAGLCDYYPYWPVGRDHRIIGALVQRSSNYLVVCAGSW